ncbi:helix-turn-helix domain-containing protein [Ligilactobacillus salivarius]|uniref:helix-turn-helix domain-containing protein n=1 Tax=Ligilactobacillus salivarius TaxID=1624 RepID=UPI0015D70624|nr:helix-turn-helix transcriptional regulator [Ligilactobacillus salivarius]
MILVPKITLKAARVNAGLTQKEAAEKIGISYQTLSEYEKDESRIKLAMIKKMCNVYGMPIDCIFFK